jgi:hypothetical protein
MVPGGLGEALTEEIVLRVFIKEKYFQNLLMKNHMSRKVEIYLKAF